MYSLLLVEDELLIREGLCQTVPWGEMGFKLCGVAENGNIAWQLFKVQRHQLVVTDIRMPSMNGIELLKQIKRLSPSTCVVLLSGYEDFEYARQGIQYGASSYILKLNLHRELPAAMESVRNQLDTTVGEVPASRSSEQMQAGLTIDQQWVRRRREEMEMDQAGDRVARVLDYIHNNLNVKPTLKEAAELVHINPSYLSVLFKEKIGQSFTEYLIERRLERASELLAGGMKVADTAEYLGYDDLKHFRQAFKKRFGLNPSELK